MLLWGFLGTDYGGGKNTGGAQRCTLFSCHTYFTFFPLGLKFVYFFFYCLIQIFVIRIFRVSFLRLYLACYELFRYFPLFTTEIAICFQKCGDICHFPLKFERQTFCIALLSPYRNSDSNDWIAVHKVNRIRNTVKVV